MRSFLSKRNLLAIIIVASGVAASFLVLRTPAKPAVEGIVVASATSTNPQLDFTLEPLSNLTDEFTDRALSNLIDKNQNNTSDQKNITTLPSSADVEKIVGDIIDRETAKEQPDVSKVHRSDDDSKEMQIAYLVVIDTIIQESAKKTPTAAQMSSLDTYFSSIGDAFRSTADLLEAMNVPPSWVDIHAKLIAFYAVQAEIYHSLGAGPNDPLRFMIALRRAPAHTEQAFSALKDEIDQRMKEQKLI